MAVSNAIGVWLHEYPVTPEKVLKALGKTGSSRLNRSSSSNRSNSLNRSKVTHGGKP
jgi:hypothetical protein